MNIIIPDNVEYILNELMKHGFEAYAVGGCVRDTLLGRIPGDWDITTSAKPMEVKELFKRTIDTGIEHGTVTVMIQKEGYEVTTYRVDGEYEDNRHPKKVEFTSNLVEDLKRRDFTINAMAYNHKDGLVDVFDGLGDIKKKVIRCVGNPRERFDEDGLRILRAVRFAGQLGFEIDEETKKAIQEKATHLRNISAERIREELSKLFLSDGVELLLIAYELGITKVVLEEFDKMMETEQRNPHHIYNVGVHTIESMKQMNELVKENKTFSKKEKLILCFSMLLHDVGKPETKTTDSKGKDHFYGHPELSEKQAKQILKRLKFDNVTVDTVSKLVKYHDYRIEPTKVATRRGMNRIGKELMPFYFLVQKSDVLAQSEYQKEEKLQRLQQVCTIYEQILKDHECVNLKGLKVNGTDLISEGFRPGKELGVLLNELLERVIENPNLNDKETLIKLAKQIQLV